MNLKSEVSRKCYRSDSIKVSAQSLHQPVYHLLCGHRGAVDKCAAAHGKAAVKRQQDKLQVTLVC